MDISTSTPSAAVSPLRQRMRDDMRMLQFAEHTQGGYIRAVRKLAAFLGLSPHTATAEDLRRFQLHLVDTGSGPVTINATITGALVVGTLSTENRTQNPPPKMNTGLRHQIPPPLTAARFTRV